MRVSVERHDDARCFLFVYSRLLSRDLSTGLIMRLELISSAMHLCENGVIISSLRTLYFFQPCRTRLVCWKNTPLFSRVHGSTYRVRRANRRWASSDGSDFALCRAPIRLPHELRLNLSKEPSHAAVCQALDKTLIRRSRRSTMISLSESHLGTAGSSSRMLCVGVCRRDAKFTPAAERFSFHFRHFVFDARIR